MCVHVFRYLVIQTDLQWSTLHVLNLIGTSLNLAVHHVSVMFVHSSIFTV